jgi:hypothetical protein
MIAATSNTRLCGAGRVQGGVYFEVATSPYGAPLESFLFCPPIVLEDSEIQEFGISPSGMSLLKRPQPDGSIIYHVADWIGVSHYPDIWDFLSEGNALNFSRRVPSTFDFSKLTKESRIYFIHARGWIENWHEYFEHEPTYPLTKCCPHDVASYKMNGRFPVISEHSHSYKHETFCSRLWKQDLTNSKQTSVEYLKTESPNAEIAQRLIRKKLPCGATYDGFLRPIGINPVYKIAIIGAFPLGRIAVVKSPDGKHTTKTEKARKQDVFEVVEVDE